MFHCRTTGTVRNLFLLSWQDFLRRAFRLLSFCWAPLRTSWFHHLWQEFRQVRRARAMPAHPLFFRDWCLKVLFICTLQCFWKCLSEGNHLCSRAFLDLGLLSLVYELCWAWGSGINSAAASKSLKHSGEFKKNILKKGIGLSLSPHLP